MRFLNSLFACCLCLSIIVSMARAEVGVKKTDSGVEVTIDGQPFTTYIFDSGMKPVLWPIIGPTGKEMTRAWPLRKDDPSEKTDHKHQKSFWFDHGNVSRVNFWMEPFDPNLEKAKSENLEKAKSEKKEPAEKFPPLYQGKQQHKALLKADGGKVGTIVTANDWIDLDHDKEKMLSDVRTLRFGGNKEMRWIDFDVVVTAAKDGVTFLDTKEGSFGLRIAESMRVDRGGKVMTSEGLTDGGVMKDPMPCWGQPAAWIDYSGTVQGETLGIAILNHPSSFRYPTRWHVRVYGLFAANPWGLQGFTKSDERGDYTMKTGDSFTLRYRVIFHKGDEKQGQIAQRFAEYTKE